MTPLEVFYEELKKSGWACAIVPGGPFVCCTEPRFKVIQLGADLDPDTQGIVGLHELGHVYTMPLFSVFAYFFRESAYAMELAAWDWAEKRIPPGYEELTAACKKFGLESHF